MSAGSGRHQAPTARRPRPLATRTFAALVLVAGLVAPSPAHAQPKGSGATPPAAPAASGTSTAEPLTDDQIKAQQHFQRAKDLYQQGAYREAIAELEVAHGLDPKAKDLVFNLGIVHERLGKFDEAIAWFQKYIALDNVTAQEKQRAEGVLKRIEGAKRELPAATPTTTTTPTAPAAPAQREKPPARGRVDALTISAASLAVIGIGVGVGFGIVALSSRPNDFVTGRDGTYDDLRSKQDTAHTSAIVADIGFGVGIVAAVAAAYLYFSRTKDPVRTGSVTPSLVPGGGALLLGGSFR